MKKSTLYKLLWVMYLCIIISSGDILSDILKFLPILVLSTLEKFAIIKETENEKK